MDIREIFIFELKYIRKHKITRITRTMDLAVISTDLIKFFGKASHTGS